MLIPFKFTLYEVAAAVALTGVAADPQIGSGTVDIGSVVVPPVEELVIGGRRWYGILEDETVYLTGVVANPRIGSGTVRVSREISERLYFPKRQPKQIDSSGLVGDLIKLKFHAQRRLRLIGVQSAPAVGTGVIKPVVVQLTGVEVTRIEKVVERFEEEMLAFLDAA